MSVALVVVHESRRGVGALPLDWRRRVRRDRSVHSDAGLVLPTPPAGALAGAAGDLPVFVRAPLAGRVCGLAPGACGPAASPGWLTNPSTACPDRRYHRGIVRPCTTGGAMRPRVLPLAVVTVLA